MLLQLFLANLPSSLQDVDSAVFKLDMVLMCIALVGIIFICLLIFNRQNTLASLVPLATLILGFSFIFGHSAQVLFESVGARTLFSTLVLISFRSLSSYSRLMYLTSVIWL